MKPKRFPVALSAILLLMIIGTASNASAEEAERTIRAEGFGLTEADALLEAKRNAVEQGIGTVLLSQTEMANFELKRDTVLSRTIGAVKQYRIIREAALPDNNHQVEIEAVVSLADIKADLAALNILLESMDRPRTMVLIRDDEGGIAANTILAFLAEKSFPLVDPTVVAALLDQNDVFLQTAFQGDPKAAARLGAANGAEYLLLGRVSRTTGPAPFDMISGQAVINARVINCSTAAVIAAAAETAAVSHLSAAVAREKATERAARTIMEKKLLGKIIAAFQNSANNGIILEVTITGVNQYAMQSALMETVDNLPDALSVVRRSFGSGRLQLSVRYQGSVDAFCRSMDGLALNGHILSISDIGGNRITARLTAVPRQ